MTSPPQPVELRPLSLGELLDRTFSLYRRHFWLFVGIMAIPSAFYVPFSVLLFSGQGGRLGPTPTPGSIATLFSLVFLFLGVFYFAYAIGLGAATYAVSENYLGQQPTVRSSYAKVRPKLWKILGVIFNVLIRLFGVLLVGGIGVGIVVAGAAGTLGTLRRPGPAAAIVIGVVAAVLYIGLMALFVIWSLRYAISIPALLLENTGVLAAIRRSVRLTSGRKWQIFVAVILTTIIGYAGVIVFQGPTFVAMMVSTRPGPQPVWLTFTAAASGAIGNAVTSPLLMIVLVLCYYDARIRKEAFDLRFMLSSLDSPAPAAGTAGAAGAAPLA